MDNTDIFTDIVKKHDKELGGLITDLITENNKLTKERDELEKDFKKLAINLTACIQSSVKLSKENKALREGIESRSPMIDGIISELELNYKDHNRDKCEWYGKEDDEVGISCECGAGEHNYFIDESINYLLDIKELSKDSSQSTINQDKE